MHGDRPGSPERDVRPNADQPGQLLTAPPDIKVAGTPLGAGEPDPYAIPDPQAFGVPAGPPRGGAPAATGRRFGPVKIGAAAAAAVVVVGGGAVAAMAMTGGSDGGKATVTPTRAAADNAAPQVDPSQLAEQQRQQALDRAGQEARRDASKRRPLLPKGTPPTKKPPSGGGGDGDPPSAGNPTPVGEAQRIAKRLLPSYGFSPSTQFGCLVNLWNRESGWNTHAANPSGAYGIPQAKPGSKMSSAGPDWRNNATTQIKWGLGYIKGRYSTPCGAWAAFKSKGWY